MLRESIRGAARRFGDRAFLIDPSGRPWSYAEIDRASDEAAVGMARAGVSEGDVVVLTLPSIPAYVVAYLAAAKLGAAAAGVNPRLSGEERDRLVEMAEPALVVGSPDQVDGLRVAGEVPPDLEPDPCRVVAVVFTSGTTGTPKGAVFDEARVRAVCEVDVGLGTWGGGGPMLASTEFAHVGFMTKLAWYLRLGTTQLLMERWRADDALRLAAEHRMTAMGGVPPQFALMLRSPVLDEVDLTSVETVVLGAAPASPALRAEIMDRFGARLSVRYSSTESGGAGTGTAFDAPEHEALHTEGRPRGPIELSIRDDDGEELPAGEVGEVCLRTPTAMVGYWRDPDATAAAFWPDGSLRTGDLGRVDEGGCLVMAGRSKEMYVRGGYNVFPQEVERVLVDHPAVRDVAVVPRPDDVMGEVGVAVVVPADDPPTLEGLREFAAARLAGYKLPEAMVTTDALPLNPTHKLDRRALHVLVLDSERRNYSAFHCQEPGRDPGDA